MKMTRLLALAACALISACDSEGIQRPPPADVRFFNAAPNFERIEFLREEAAEASLLPGNGSRRIFDSGPYDFHLQITPVASGPIRPFSFSADLSPSRKYTVVAVSPGSDLEALIISTPDFPQDSANARFTLVHAHPGVGSLDFYLVAAGTPLGSTTPQGNSDFGADPAIFETAPGDLRLYITPAGDPASILFESEDLDIGAGSDNVLVVSDSGGLSVAPLIVTLVDDPSPRVAQVGNAAQIRVVQAIDDRLARDVLLDGATPPLFAAVAYGELSDYAPLPSPPHSFSLTPAGNPGTVEEEITSFSPIPGRFYTMIFSGDTTDGIVGNIAAEDRRSIVGQATLRAFHLAGLFDAIDIYVRAPGTDLSTVGPTISFALAGSVTPRLPTIPGDYELTVIDPDTSAVLYGPTPLTLADGGVYGLLTTNSADGSTVDIDFIYDLAP